MLFGLTLEDLADLFAGLTSHHVEDVSSGGWSLGEFWMNAYDERRSPSLA
jgi:hypothetical protein